MIIGCSDARVDPAFTFDTEPGDVFMVRNVANIVPPYMPDGDYHGTSAALEFAVRFLEVPHIVVLGHAQCGGIAALLRQGGSGVATDFIEPWMSIVSTARETALAIAHECGHAPDAPETHRLCEQEGIRASLANLLTFPWIAQRVEAGQLQIHGWYFDIPSGTLSVLGADSRFAAVPAEDDAAPAPPSP